MENEETKYGDFRDLEVWQLCKSIRIEIWNLCITFPKVFRLKKADGRPDIFTPDAMDMIFRISGGIPRTINLLCDSALIYGFAEEATEIDTPILKLVVKELGFMGLYGKNSSAAVHQQPVAEKIEGNGFLHRLEKLEEKIQKIQLQMDWQNGEIDRKINGYKKRLVARLKAHLLNERKRSNGLLEENRRLKQKLKELGSRAKR